MKVIVKEIWSYIIDIPLDIYKPEDTKCFGLWLNILIGPIDAEGGHDYQILVCTPKWLSIKCAKNKSVWGKNMLIVFEYDIALIRNEINQCIENCSGKDWLTISQEFAKFAAWEYA